MADDKTRLFSTEGMFDKKPGAGAKTLLFDKSQLGLDGLATEQPPVAPVPERQASAQRITPVPEAPPSSPPGAVSQVMTKQRLPSQTKTKVMDLSAVLPPGVELPAGQASDPPGAPRA